MRFLVNLPHMSERPSDLTTPDALAEAARAVEAAGLHACGVSDHPFPVVDGSQPGHQTWDPFSLLAYLAAVTDRIALATLAVILPYRNPFLVANAARTLDHIAKGRLILGVATGYLRPEFEALGADFERRDAFVEASLVAMKAAWTAEPVFASQSTWRAAGNRLSPAPVTTPHPPLWMGGNSNRAIERAARHCTGWAPVLKGPEAATATRSASIESVDELAARIRTLRLQTLRFKREEPLDVCLLRSRVGWSAPEPTAQIVEEVAELEDAGVTWVAFHPEATSKKQLLDRIAAWGATFGEDRR
jgi:probable F420-dependent oxidoreductase